MSSPYTTSSATGITLTNHTTQNPVSITSTGTISPGYGNAIYADAAYGWQITNNGLLQGVTSGIELLGASTITNTGSIGGTSQAGIALLGGGHLTNQGSGQISGATYGVSIAGAAGTVVNTATLTATGTAGIGLALADGGLVSNSATAALIAGQSVGVQLSAAASTLDTLGRIEAQASSGIGVSMAGGVLDNQNSTAGAGTISGGYAGVLAQGGTITNGATSAATVATIYGGYFGIAATGAVSITNAGSIGGGTSAAGGLGLGPAAGVQLDAGGTLSNLATGTIASAQGDGVYLAGISAANAASVVNHGLIEGATNGVVLGAGLSSGMVVNAGSIAGNGVGGFAVLFGASGDTLVADAGAGFTGAISAMAGDTLELATGTGTGTLSGLGSATGVYGFDQITIDTGATWSLSGSAGSYASAGTLTNAGTLLASSALNFNAWSIDNTGSIAGQLYLDSADTLTNTGHISGTGAVVVSQYGLVSNTGTILNTDTSLTAPTDSAVYISDGGSLTNAAHALISGYQGVYNRGAPMGGAGIASITNAGTILGTGTSGAGGLGAVVLRAGGDVTNQASGSISGFYGVLGQGSSAAQTLSVTNAGNISSAQRAGIYLGNSGYVTNQAGGTIYGFDAGVQIGTIAATIANLGTIGSALKNDAIAIRGGAGVEIVNQASGTAHGLIGAGTGIYDHGNATASVSVDNAGTITGTFGGGFGIGLYDAALTLTNRAGATLYGNEFGIYAANAYAGSTITNLGTLRSSHDAVKFVDLSGPTPVADTIVNAGSIIGGNGIAIDFGLGNDTLQIDPGAYFLGTVNGAGGTNTLILASAAGAGSFGGLGSQFLNFEQIDVAANAQWTLSGANTIAVGTTLSIAAGAGLTVSGSAITVAAGASLDVIGAATGGAAYTLQGSGLTLSNAPAAAADFTLQGSADTLALNGVSASSLTNTITGFGAGDTLNFAAENFAAGSTAIETNGTLSVSLAGGGLFTLAGLDTAAITPANLQISAHAITDPLCFAAGTAIATPEGPRAVETLRPGDLVCRLDETPAPIRWIGYRRIDLARHLSAEDAAPIRVAADAIAPACPARDLLLSPEHAILIGEVLVPVRLLVNGGSIRAEPGRGVVSYFHLELDAHALLLAEGLPCESYLDTGNRSQFANAPGAVALHPRFAAADAQTARLAGSCRTVLSDAAELAPIWQSLAARSESLGFAPCAGSETAADLRLIADGRALAPIEATESAATFLVPAGCVTLMLASRAARVDAARPWLGDRRVLGVMVTAIEIAPLAGGVAQALALDDPRLDRGWHAPESDGVARWRWTDGAALLPALAGAAMLRIRLGAPMLYPSAAASSSSAAAAKARILAIRSGLAVSSVRSRVTGPAIAMQQCPAASPYRLPVGPVAPVSPRPQSAPSTVRARSASSAA